MKRLILGAGLALFFGVAIDVHGADDTHARHIAKMREICRDSSRDAAKAVIGIANDAKKNEKAVGKRESARLTRSARESLEDVGSTELIQKVWNQLFYLYDKTPSLTLAELSAAGNGYCLSQL